MPSAGAIGREHEDHEREGAFGGVGPVADVEIVEVQERDTHPDRIPDHVFPGPRPGHRDRAVGRYADRSVAAEHLLDRRVMQGHCEWHRVMLPHQCVRQL